MAEVVQLKKPKPRQAWEYRVERISLRRGGRPEDVLNAAGAEGWELVVGQGFPPERVVLIFKRPVTDA